MIEDKYLRGVLVVDDEPLVLKYTTSVISGLGYRRVLQAGTAEEARSILLHESISLIISDVRLPDGDGRQLVAHALEVSPHTNGVLITGFESGDLTLPSDLVGRVQILHKPFTADDITQILSDLLERRSTSSAAARA